MQYCAMEALQPVQPVNECSNFPVAIPKQPDPPVPTVSTGNKIPSKWSRTDERLINPKEKVTV